MKGPLRDVSLTLAQGTKPSAHFAHRNVLQRAAADDPDSMVGGTSGGGVRVPLRMRAATSGVWVRNGDPSNSSRQVA